ncbi:hypothetical protein [Taklimakanibacter deserti]|uniref:hypothetical protein n=1 Tax=Taklimakanibacter deserti TaxID=2267839 RepID=UPI0013C44B35
MLAYAATHSPYYREQQWAKMTRRGGTVDIRNIPTTAKSLVRSNTSQFYVAEVPASEGRVMVAMTSGSTGAPMEVRHTKRFQDISFAERQRLAAGWGLDRHARVVKMHDPRPDRPRGAVVNRTAAKTIYDFYSADASEAFDFIARTKATLLHAPPRTVTAILQHGEDIGVRLPLKLIATISEVIPEQFRSLVNALPGCRWVDRYATIETKLIAVTCADCGAYHLADRHAVIEILDDRNRPVKPGKMGRVVVTPLFNLAMPLVRYETGDHALVTATNTCRRSPFALERIVGREGNLFKLPNGHRVIPWIDPRAAFDAGLRQFKLVQVSPVDIDFLYIPRDGAADLTGDRAQELIDKSMVTGFKVTPRKVAEMPLSASRKFLMHECLI